MRSLTLKFTLAFFLVSLIGIAIVAAFFWVSTTLEFNTFVLERGTKEFVDFVSEYYRANGSWTGVEDALRKRMTNANEMRDEDEKTPLPPLPFALIDEKQTVVIAANLNHMPPYERQKAFEQSVPVEVNGVIVGRVVTTGQPPPRSPGEDRFISRAIQALFTAVIGGAIISLILGTLLARTLTRPARELTAAARALARGQLGQQVTVRSRDELGQLTDAFNQMSADLTRANQSRRQMTADIAHDLRNPITVIAGYLESLRYGVLKPTPERFEIMQCEVQHLQHLVEDLRTLSQAEAGELVINRQLIAPGELLNKLFSIYKHPAEQQKVELKLNIEPDLPKVKLDRERMEQVLGNLVTNALRYTPAGGQIEFSAYRHNGGIVLGVSDTGTGIAPDILPNIFERSYCGDPSRQGNQTGLGLAIARSIVNLHAGTITASSDGIGKGSQFHIFLTS